MARVEYCDMCGKMLEVVEVYIQQEDNIRLVALWRIGLPPRDLSSSAIQQYEVLDGFAMCSECVHQLHTDLVAIKEHTRIELGLETK